MGNETIPRVDHAKFLGVFIDDQLQWGYHIDYISKKITSGVYAINAVKRYICPLKTWKPCILVLYILMYHMQQ